MLFLKRIFSVPFILTITPLLFLPVFISNAFHYEIMIIAILNAAVVLGLNLLLGYVGQISLAHGAFFIVCPYLTVIFISKLNLPFALAILLSLTALLLLSFLIALPIIHLKGHYFAMATLGIGLILYIILNNEVELTGGPDGLEVPDLATLLTTPSGMASDVASDGMALGELGVFGSLGWYYLVVAFFTGILIVVNLLNQSKWKIVLQSIRFNEKNVFRLGLSTRWIKIVIFSFSVLIAGLAGNLYAFYAGFISPQDANFIFSVELIAMAIIGGIGNFYGGIVGAFLLTLLPQVLIYFADWKHLLLGVIIMVVIIFLPNGLGGLGGELVRAWKAIVGFISRKNIKAQDKE